MVVMILGTVLVAMMTAAATEFLDFTMHEDTLFEHAQQVLLAWWRAHMPPLPLPHSLRHLIPDSLHPSLPPIHSPTNAHTHSPPSVGTSGAVLCNTCRAALTHAGASKEGAHRDERELHAILLASP